MNTIKNSFFYTLKKYAFHIFIFIIAFQGMIFIGQANTNGITMTPYMYFMLLGLLIFTIGLAYFSENFGFFQQQNVSRKTFFFINIINELLLAAGLSIITFIALKISQHWFNNFLITEVLFEAFPNTPMPSAFILNIAEILCYFLIYIFIYSVGLLWGSLAYASWKKFWLYNLGFVGIVILIFRLLANFPTLWQSFIRYLALFSLGMNFTTNTFQPLYPALFLILVSLIINFLSYLLIKKMIVK